MQIKTLNPTDDLRGNGFHEQLAVVDGANRASDTAQFRGEILKAATTHGAVLIRGTGVESNEDFEEFIRVFDLNLVSDYLGGTSPRPAAPSVVFSSTEADAAAVITPHTEMAYLPYRPRFLCFGCLVEPTEAGETPLYPMQRGLKALPEAVRDKLASQGLRYTRFMHKERHGWFGLQISQSWSEAFANKDKADVERVCGEHGLETRWFGSILRLHATLPGIVIHPESGQPCLNMYACHWRSLLYANRFLRGRRRRARMRNAVGMAAQRFPFTTFVKVGWGNGESFSKREALEFDRTLWGHSLAHRWRKGDVLLIDNVLTAHGRLDVEPPRKVVVSMGDLYTVEKSDECAGVGTVGGAINEPGMDSPCGAVRALSRA